MQRPRKCQPRITPTTSHVSTISAVTSSVNSKLLLLTWPWYVTNENLYTIYYYTPLCLRTSPWIPQECPALFHFQLTSFYCCPLRTITGGLGQSLRCSASRFGRFFLRQRFGRTWTRFETARLPSYARTQRTWHLTFISGTYSVASSSWLKPPLVSLIIACHPLEKKKKRWLQSPSCDRNPSTASTNGKIRCLLCAKRWRWRKTLPSPSRR